MGKIIFTILCVLINLGENDTILVGQSRPLATNIKFELECNTSINAGTDIVLCNEEVGQLKATVIGKYSNIKWSPSLGLDNDTILNPMVDIQSTTKYFLEVISYNDNIILNGDFETGDISPSTTTFSWRAPEDFPNGVSGHYSVGNSSSIVFVPGCNGQVGDNMMVTNGPGENVWCQTVNVEPNTNYRFEVWIGGVEIFILANSSKVEIEINDELIGSVKGDDFCDWTLFNSIWNSGSNTTAKICLNTDGNGRSYAIIDGISLRKQCVATDSVFAKAELVNAQIAIPDTISCNNHPIILDGSGSSSGNGYTYEWSTSDGLIIGQQNTTTPIIDLAGTYRLKVTGPLNCIDEIEVEVFGNTHPPIIDILGSHIDCKNNSVTLTATSPSNFNLTYNWIGPFGFSSNQQAIITSMPGEYIVTCTDEFNCSSHDTFIVKDLKSQKNHAFSIEEFNCDTDSARIILQNIKGNARISWHGPNGFTSSLTDFYVQEEGKYIVEIVDSADCVFHDTINIVDSRSYANILLKADTINCSQSKANLIAHSDSNNVTFNWTGPNGFVDSIAITETSDSGWHYLIASIARGCAAIDSIFVENDTKIPSLDIPNYTLNCNMDEITISPLTNDPNVKAMWTGPNGFTSNELNITVSDSGQYVLNIMSANGCSNKQESHVIKTPNFTGFIQNEIFLNFGENYQLEIQTNRLMQEIASINWSPHNNLSCTDCLDPIITATNNQTFNATITDIFGCILTLKVRIIVHFSEDIYIPNSFTPNGDGINDYFKIFTKDKTLTQLNIQIYDRWGNTVYSMNDLTPDLLGSALWDGRYNGKFTNPGIYVYTISYELINGRMGTLNGSITLLR